MNAKTRDEVLICRWKNPYATQAEIAQVVGVSRERVRQILKSLGLPPVVKNPEHYNPCGSCGKPMLRVSPTIRKKYCNKTCQSSAHTVTVECIVCGKLFIMATSRWTMHANRYNSISCSMECRGVSIGRQIRVTMAKKRLAKAD